MSLSLSGYFLPHSLDIVFSMLHQTRPLHRTLRQEKLARAIANRVATLVDETWYAGNTIETPFRTILSQVSKERQEIRQRTRHPEVDTEMELTLFPYKTGTLIMVITETSSWHSLISSLPGAVDMDYYDGECPSDMDTKTWEDRREAWYHVMAPDWVPVNHGLVFKYNDFGTLPKEEDILKYIPDTMWRAQKVAQNIYLTRWIKNNGIGNISRGFFSMQDTENALLIEKDREKIAPTLPVITLDTLENGHKLS